MPARLVAVAADGTRLTADVEAAWRLRSTSLLNALANALEENEGVRVTHIDVEGTPQLFGEKQAPSETVRHRREGSRSARQRSTRHGVHVIRACQGRLPGPAPDGSHLHSRLGHDSAPAGRTGSGKGLARRQQTEITHPAPKPAAGKSLRRRGRSAPGRTERQRRAARPALSGPPYSTQRSKNSAMGAGTVSGFFSRSRFVYLMTVATFDFLRDFFHTSGFRSSRNASRSSFRR